MIQKHDASFDAIVVVAVEVKIKFYSRYQIKQWEYFHANFHFAIMLQIIILRYEQSLKLSLHTLRKFCPLPDTILILNIIVRTPWSQTE